MQISRKKGDSFLVVSQHSKEPVKILIDGDITVCDFSITGPGEYEIQGVYVLGVAPSIYAIEAEGISVCTLGAFDGKELTVEQVDQIGNVDILLSPGNADRKNIIAQIQPRIVVKTEKEKGDEVLSKLSLKQKDLTGEETKTIVLE